VDDTEDVVPERVNDAENEVPERENNAEEEASRDQDPDKKEEPKLDENSGSSARTFDDDGKISDL